MCSRECCNLKKAYCICLLTGYNEFIRETNENVVRLFFITNVAENMSGCLRKPGMQCQSFDAGDGEWLTFKGKEKEHGRTVKEQICRGIRTGR